MSDENVERAAAAIGSVCGMDLTWNQRHEAARAVIAALDASRPREAGSGEDGLAQAAAACQSIALRYEAQAGEWNANAKAYAARECARAIHALRRGATHAQSHPSPGGGNAQVGGATERAAGIVPQAGSNVAPEACPVAWAVVDASGEFWDAAPLLSKDYADKRVATLNRKYGQIVNTPYRVVPLYAQPASATAERGGDVRLFMRACQVLGCGARGVTENAGPWYCAIHHPEHPATPASAAGREGAVEKVVEAAKAWATSRVDHDASNVALLVAVDALLAAEAAERGEEEA